MAIALPFVPTFYCEVENQRQNPSYFAASDLRRAISASSK